ncbi:DUF3606 domain-containing protein [Roseomonas populi]|uniref:DUF3606 domain-containing protein n=1 Tax=Roseomonas populi TaxID=3121582 RepID=A0ABT1X6L5_9PROT|nr:DUF3606 domain-containing protein [Roseomonas pecuniae]MCR0983728.1 DUF3606 domain-containing protein [Roseomonas pecuniae]
MSEVLRSPSAARNRIDLDDPYCVQHWARNFRITELDLTIAVQQAGPLVQDVALLLRQPVPGSAEQQRETGLGAF